MMRGPMMRQGHKVTNMRAPSRVSRVARVLLAATLLVADGLADLRMELSRTKCVACGSTMAIGFLMRFRGHLVEDLVACK